MEFSLIDEGGISIWSGYKPHQHNLKWLAESECVGIWKTKIRTLILVDCRSVLLSFVCKTIVNIVLGNLVPVPHQMPFICIIVSLISCFRGKKNETFLLYVCTYNHDGMVIYNTMTGAVIALNQYYSRMYQDIYLADSDFATNMQKGGFFVNDQKDEVAELLQISTYARENLTSRSYTIAPTLSCNFRCPYCFEDGHRYNTMTDAVIDKTIAFINNDAQEAEAVSIAWYGGEPLLCPEIIQRITENIHVKDGGFTASVITNGYFLDRKMAEFLQRQKVGYAQVTVDGPPDIHNARRRLPNGQDTFHRILSNVAEANDYLKINLRVNVDASNRDRIDDIFDFLDNYGLRGKVQLYLAAVENIHGSCNNGTCLEDHEFSAFEASFYERNVDRGYSFIYLPCFNPTICGAVTKTMCIIDPIGDLYKCWNEIGMHTRSYGSIFGGNNRSSIDQWNNYQVASYEECRECAFLPVCMGGCPYRSISGGSKQCISVKYNYERLIRILAERVKKRNEKNTSIRN